MPGNQNPLDYRPPRTGNASDDLFKKNVLDFIYELRGQISNIQIPTVPSYQQIASQLQLGGIAPINISGLVGGQNTLQGTHAQRIAGFPPASNPNLLYFETDRIALYLSNGNQWLLVEGLSFGTFEGRWTGLNTFDSGFIYIESSRNNAASISPYPVYRWSGANWVALEGRFLRAQANLATLTTTLGPNDNGVTANISDFNHMLAWNGTGWGWGAGDPGSGYIQGFLVDPSPTTGWQLCDGTTNVAYLQANGNVGTQTVPDMTSAANKAAFLLFGNTASATLNPPVQPILMMNSYTPGGAIGGSNTITPSGSIASSFTGNALAAHDHDAPIGDTANFLGMYTLNVNNNNGNNYTAISKAVSVADNSTIMAQKTSPTSAGTPAGNVTSIFAGNSNTINGSSFTFTGNAATLTGNISNNGTPQSVTLRPWFRK